MKFTKEEIERFERQSLENMVYFYREELFQIMREQKSAYKNLPVSVRKRLTDGGIIIKRFGLRFEERNSYSVTLLGMEMLM